MDNRGIILVSSLILALGIFAAGYSFSRAFYLTHVMDRTVTVKGLTERDVKSDLSIWELDFRDTGNNLVDLNQRIMNYQKIVTDFLKNQGFATDELELQPVKVEDRMANVYQSSNDQSTANQRFIVTGGINVRSKKVMMVRKASQAASALLQQGVPLAVDTTSGNPNPSYYFTDLDAIRPSMLADATLSAKKIAKQFAKDTDTRLAGIQSANQGVFQIMSRDTSTMSADWNNAQSALSAIDKKVRLVTTIQYRIVLK